MKQTVRHGLGIALSAMAFLCNYSPWVREATSLPDALTLTSGQKFVVQTGLPMLAASDGGTVSVLASQDERVTISAEAGGQTSVTFSLLGLIPVHETRVNVVEERTLIPGGQAVGVALKTRGVLVVSDAAKGRALRAGDVILSADGKNVESTKALSEQVGTAQTDTVRLEVLRGGQTITVDAQAEPDPSDGRRKLGVWVRDSTAGVGTLTYIDPANQAYGALGHAIVDADTGRLLAAREGAILHASIVGVTKGQSGKAGELKGNFLKAGAASTFIKRDHWVESITSESLAAGLVQQIDFETASRKLYHGDYLIMMTDGVLDALPAQKEEETMKEIIMDVHEDSPKDFGRGILERVLGYSDYRARDDMTVLVAGVWKK